MRDVAIIGEPEFTLGFRLAGIKKVISTNAPETAIKEVLGDNAIGLVIIDEASLAKLSAHAREDIIKSLSPVFVTVSETAAQDELRKMIIQSVGVDLLKEE